MMKDAREFDSSGRDIAEQERVERIAARVSAEPDDKMVEDLAGVIYRRNPIHIEDRPVPWQSARKMIPHVYAGCIKDARAVIAAYRANVLKGE